MLEKVNEPINVIASFTYDSKKGPRALPYLISWRSRRYKIDQFGLYHPERRGTKRVHIFSFSSGPTAFRVELDPETLEWTLAEVYYES